MRLARFALAALLAPMAPFARDLPATVRDALAADGVPLSAVAVRVEGVDGRPILLSQREHAAMNPASVMKLVTSEAALDLLGPAFRFRTDVLLDGTLKDGVLEGNLVLRGGGDPKLTYDRLWQMLHRLRARGLREIRGDVIVDRGYFAPAAYDAAAFDERPRRAYNVAPDAMLVNFGAVDFTFIPGDDAVRVVAEPDLPSLQVTSRLRLVPGSCGEWRHDVRFDVHDEGMVATVAFAGAYPESCGEKSWPLAVLGPQRYFESLFRWLWSEVGGKLSGKVRDGATPAGALLFYRERSQPLAVLLRDMNKYSNNVMARNLFLALSAEPDGGAGDAQRSAEAVRGWLASKGIDAPELALENGSGLSRGERVSAATLAALLREAWAGGSMPELAASLPIFAVDGTFKDREGAQSQGRAHVKGGTLDGVQSLAGYVLDRAGRRWIVVMMINHPNANRAQDALDALVEWVSEQGAPTPGRHP
ncbi:MAG TPA: D-alanyl-D-alanine carboxypeptidase/D-alanyl-D-alanine-endopeptidase [Usitatibacter sp.]|nr:D-alanyl-D-alanine carboxypeptidase/D-alanyl-D-alanine-endopeptidase [Usitatibacter sp.]